MAAVEQLLGRLVGITEAGDPSFAPERLMHDMQYRGEQEAAGNTKRLSRITQIYKEAGQIIPLIADLLRKPPTYAIEPAANEEDATHVTGYLNKVSREIAI